MPSTIRAERDGRFYMRFLLIGIVMCGFSLYCVYDGAVTYPREHERAVAYKKLQEELTASKQAEQFSKEWSALAKEKGWPTNKPHDENDIIEQFIMAAATAALGLGFLLAVWRSRGRWIEADESGI